MEMENIPFSLDEVLSNLANIVAIKTEEKGLELFFNVRPDVPDALIGDPLRLGQIFVNLVNNAVIFSVSLGRGKEDVRERYVPAVDLRGMRTLVVDDNATARALFTIRKGGKMGQRFGKQIKNDWSIAPEESGAAYRAPSIACRVQYGERIQPLPIFLMRGSGGRKKRVLLRPVRVRRERPVSDELEDLLHQLVRKIAEREQITNIRFIPGGPFHFREEDRAVFEKESFVRSIRRVSFRENP